MELVESRSSFVEPRLSKIETLWSVVREAGADSTGSHAAQSRLLEVYGGAVRRYLLGALRDEAAADEVFQEFALRFVRGDFKSADPERGRFRSFVKTAVYHLIVDHQRRRKRDQHQKPLVVEPEDVVATHLDEMEQEFVASWRDELLSRAWQALEEHQATTGKAYFTVLKCRSDHPSASSTDLAAELSAKLDRPVAPGNARVLLHRAREFFAELLLDAVRDSLVHPTRQDLEEELITLDLLTYCRAALDKYGP